MRTIILDNEAVQAVTDPTHAHHREVIAHFAGVVSRRRRGVSIDTIVPTTVRVEAGWDRSTPGAAAINRLRVRDHALDTAMGNSAASIHKTTGLGPADAHIGTTVRSVSSGDVIVLTSDPTDIATVSAPLTPRIVRI